MKNNITVNKVFIGACLIMLFIPLVFVTLRIKVDDRYSTKKINGNFERNFPMKDDLFSVYSYIKENIFHVNAIPEKAIQMPDGWLFTGDSFSDNFSESKGFIVFNKKETEALKTDIQEKTDWLNSLGIKYYVAVAPNKETVYGDMIAVTKKNRNTKREQIDSICAKSGFNYIDLGSRFPKNPVHPLFHKTDTHWNEYAGFFGYLSIMDHLKKDFNKQQFNILDSNNFKIVNSDLKIGDLNEMLRRDVNEPLVAFTFKDPKMATAFALEKRLTIPENYENDPLTYERRFGSKANKLKIMILNDSFGGYFLKFLSENFGETLFVWSHTFDKEMIMKEKPDIIIQEFVERNVDYLLEPQK